MIDTDLDTLLALPDDALVNGRSASTLLAVDVRTLEAMRRERRLPFVRLSRTAVRYRIGDLRAWLAERYVPAEKPVERAAA